MDGLSCDHATGFSTEDSLKGTESLGIVMAIACAPRIDRVRVEARNASIVDGARLRFGHCHPVGLQVLNAEWGMMRRRLIYRHPLEFEDDPVSVATQPGLKPKDVIMKRPAAYTWTRPNNRMTDIQGSVLAMVSGEGCLKGLRATTVFQARGEYMVAMDVVQTARATQFARFRYNQLEEGTVLEERTDTEASSVATVAGLRAFDPRGDAHPEVDPQHLAFAPVHEELARLIRFARGAQAAERREHSGQVAAVSAYIVSEGGFCGTCRFRSRFAFYVRSPDKLQDECEYVRVSAAGPCFGSTHLR